MTKDIETIKHEIKQNGSQFLSRLQIQPVNVLLKLIKYVMTSRSNS